MTSINAWIKSEQPETELLSVPDNELTNLRPVKGGPFAVVVGDDDEIVYFGSAFAAQVYAGQIGEPVAFEFVGAVVDDDVDAVDDEIDSWFGGELNWDHDDYAAA